MATNGLAVNAKSVASCFDNGFNVLGNLQEKVKFSVFSFFKYECLAKFVHVTLRSEIDTSQLP